MTERNDNGLAWSLYWAQDRLHSCLTSDNPADQQVLDQAWMEFSQQLSSTAKVLDLASGNGAVPVALLAQNKDLQVSAVDLADINPTKFVNGHEALKSVSFHGNVDLLELPFSDHQFDALSSQFGIEYAGLEQATQSVLRVLKPLGYLGFIVHHSSSEILLSSRRNIAEMAELLAPEGLLEVLRKLLVDGVEYASLEEAGQRYLDTDVIKTTSITGQVFDGINQISQLLDRDPEQAKVMGSTLDMRLRAEHQRLTQLDQAAQSDEEMQAYIDGLPSLGLQAINYQTLSADQALMGWWVQAQKS